MNTHFATVPTHKPPSPKFGGISVLKAGDEYQVDLVHYNEAHKIDMDSEGDTVVVDTPDLIETDEGPLGTHPDVGRLTIKWSWPGFTPTEADKAELRTTLERIFSAKLDDPDGIKTLPEAIRDRYGKGSVLQQWRDTIGPAALATVKRNLLVV